MIDLTPLDVRNKRGDFKKIMRGYDPHEVDVFLEIAAERLEMLVRENLQLRERTQTLQTQVEAQVGREQAVQDALVTAQALRADIQSQAQREAEYALREAESSARRLIAEAEVEARALVTEAEAEARSRMRGLERQLDHAQDSIQELERRRVRFIKEFRNLLEREMDVVQVEEGRVPYEERAIELDLGGRSREPRASGASGASGSDVGSKSAAAVTAVASLEATPGAAADPAVDEAEASRAEIGQEALDDRSDDGPEGAAGPSAEVDVSDLSPDDTLPLEALAPEPTDAPSPHIALVTQTPEVAEVRTVPVPATEPVSPEAHAPLEDSVAPEAASVTPPASAQPVRPSAPPAAVGDEPSSLELELMAGASEGNQATERDRFADIPDLETLLAESGEQLKPPPPRDIAPPPAPGVPPDNLILFDPNDPDRGS